MKTRLHRLLPFVFLLSGASAALADRLPLPADTPESYRSECGGCHLAYPPSLLVAADWQRLLAGLDRHFGSDAAVDGKNGQKIAAFLERYAGNSRHAAPAGEAPRITRTAWFSREHREIPKRFWSDPRVKSAANCEGCHTNAAAGRFSEHDIAIPELKD